MAQTMIGAGRDGVLDEVMAGVPRQLIEAESTLYDGEVLYDGDVQPRPAPAVRRSGVAPLPILIVLNAAGQTACWRQQ
jgi:hypothetical protein